MAELLKGKPVADALSAKVRNEVERLKAHNITPTLGIIRVGENESDLSYERGALKRCESTGVQVKRIILPRDVSKEDFYKAVDEANADESIHGILMFRPVPRHLDRERARVAVAYEKDLDGCSDGSLAGVFTNTPKGFAPCTAQAVIEMFDYYGIDLTGKNVTVVGRSLVVGKPLALLLMNRNATVTVCHTRTVDIPSKTRNADIVVLAAGQPEQFGKEYFREGQIVADVGISWSEAKQKITGDVKFDEVEPIVSMITPVPGGVGSVTTSVLVTNVVTAAKRAAGIE